MAKLILAFTAITLLPFLVKAQDKVEYLKAHSVRIEDPEILNDSVYTMLSSYQIIMFGEVHGTNESAPFINGLTNLFTSKGDSVQVGFEIPTEQMTEFLSQYNEKSVFESAFFKHPSFESGKGSTSWAMLIARLNNNRKVKLFFFEQYDLNSKSERGDSVMYANIKRQYLLHPNWKMITLGGNFHNKISDQSTAISYLKADKALNMFSKICSINLEYLEGSCRVNSGNGLEFRTLGHDETIYDRSFKGGKYLVLVSPKSYYEYNGFYYCKTLSAAKMVNEK